MSIINCTIPVINLRTNELTTIQLGQIQKFTKHSSRYTVYHIGEEQYRYALDNLEMIEECLLQDGFSLTDRTNVVNLHEVERFDVEYSNLYLKNASEPASVAAIQKKDVLKTLRMYGILDDTATTTAKQSQQSATLNSGRGIVFG
jgi:DNA-binding LytR/AlgR family response regulator